MSRTLPADRMSAPMTFADLALATRIERAEASLIADGAAAVRSRLGDDDAVFVEPIAGGIAVFTEPHSPLNKVAGAGFGCVPDEAAVAALARRYAERGCPVQFEVSTLADPILVGMLTRRGYVLVGFENVLGRWLDGAALETPAGIDVTCGDVDHASWLEVVVDGFATPDDQGLPSHDSVPHDSIERVISDFVAAPGVVRYLARLDGTPVGGASMRTAEGVAQLCGAATLPPFRRRGVQTALLARRLGDARAAGCDLAVITTQPGSKSQQNAHRQGFGLLYARAVLVGQA